MDKFTKTYAMGEHEGKLKSAHGKLQCRCIAVAIVLIISIVIICILTYHLTVPKSSPSPSSSKLSGDKQPPCTSPDCLSSANQMLQSLDDSVDPCDDFYRYACGGWLQKASFPSYNHLTHNPMSLLTEDNSRVVRDVLEKHTVGLPGLSNQALDKAKEVYDTCKDYAAIDETAVPDLRRVATSLGGYDFSQPWEPNAADWDLEQKIAHFDIFSSSPIVQFGAVIDLEHTDNLYIELRPTASDLPPNFNRSAFGSKSQWDLYYDTLRIFQANASTVEIEKVMLFLGGLKELVSSTYNGTIGVNATKLFSLSEVELIADDRWINWTKLMGYTFKEDPSPDFKVRIKSPGYFQHLSEYLDTADRGVIQNAFVTLMIMGMDDYLVGEITVPWYNYLRSIVGNYHYAEPRWMTCVTLVKEMMPKTTRFIFHENGIDDVASMRDHVSGLIDDIKSEAIRDLEANDWLDKATRDYAIKKANLIEKEVAFPHDVTDETQLVAEAEKTVTALGSVKMSLVNMLLVHQASSQQIIWNILKSGVNNKTVWSDGPLVVNAHYDFSKNKFTILSGILGEPFYSLAYPNYMNYGGIGYIVGHEITHAFDGTGKNFDIYGNKKPWFSAESEKEFQKRKQCFAETVPNITISISGSDYYVDGNKTADENIADAGGMKYAYLGYLKWLQRNGMERDLPGDAFSSWDKSFFTANAQLWCTDFSTLGITVWLINDVHATNEARVNGLMMNSPEFSEAFQCPTGSAMNPKKKCKLW